MPSKYALHVFSHPAKVTDSLWEEWYRKEHVPDMVNSGASTRATFFRASDKTPHNAEKFFAFYQTDIKECLDTDNYRDHVRSTSELFEDREKGCREYGAFDPRNYELIQVYDPNGVGEGESLP